MSDIAVSVSNCESEKGSSGICLIEVSVYGKSWKVFNSNYIHCQLKHKYVIFLTRSLKLVLLYLLHIV